MTAEQRRILEFAAKACGIEGVWQNGFGICLIGDYLLVPGGQILFWNPLTYPADCAEMCAELDINTFFYLSLPKVECSAEDAGDEQVIRCSQGYVQGEKLKAWMVAATLCAARIGGYTK